MKTSTAFLSPPAAARRGGAGGTALPRRLRRALEHLSGVDLRDVRVHGRSPLPPLMGARAFAHGSDVYLGPGAEDTLAHEAWHVVQQVQGRVRPTAWVNGVALNDDVELEREAEEMGHRAQRMAIGEAPRQRRGASRARPALRRAAGGVRPVVQRYITVGGPYNNILSARTIRDRLGIWYNMNAGNTPYFANVANALFAAAGNYANLDEVRLEVRRRSFGHRHVLAMNALLRAGALARNGLTWQQVNAWGMRYRGAPPGGLAAMYAGAPLLLGRYGAPGQVSGEPPWVMWYRLTEYRRARTDPDWRRTEMFRWVTGQPIFGTRTEPRLMNCYEAVLYAGGFTAGGTRQPLYVPEYAYWALQTVRRAQATFGPNANMRHNCARFVDFIIQNPTYHATSQDQNAVNGRPAVPAAVIPGSIVVFNCGEHVALATGRRINNHDGPGVGQQVIELNQRTGGIVNRNTIQDLLGNYGREIHLGFMPEKTAQEQVTLVDNNGGIVAQVQVPATNFYG